MVPVFTGPFAGQATADPISALIAAGPAGICLVLVLVGWLSPKSTIDRQAEALIDVKRQRDALAAQQAEVIPVLFQVNTTLLPAVAQSQQALIAATREIEQLRGEVKRLGDLMARGGS